MDIRFTGGLTLEEALELAYSEENDVSDIYITPPEPHVLTDEDSGDESELIPDHFTGRQLRSEAEVLFRNGDHVTESVMYDTSDFFQENERVRNDNIGNADNANADVVNTENSFLYENCNTHDIEWIRGDMTSIQNVFPSSDYSKYKNMSATELFELFFDDSVTSLLLQEIQRYALFMNFPDPKVTLAELKCFIGILIVSGYNELPGKNTTGFLKTI
nr:piggyBac transposable element-derived protein 2-like isoform X2 [Leptinotarsa decemlineata]